MSTELLYRVSEPLIAIVMLVLLLLATEFGYWKGFKSRERISEAARSPISTISGGTLGLLALLLGFSFSMALSRYELRTHLVMEESNAIGTTYLRSRLLPEPVNKEAASLLRQYVDTRVDFHRTVHDQTKLNELTNRTEELQRQLWLRVPIAVEKDSRPSTTGLFTQSLNELIDIYGARRAAIDNHVPESIVFLLLCVSIMAVLGIGFVCGLGQQRNLFSTVMLAVLLMLVMTAIIDLDRPRRGLIRVREDSMLRLQSTITQEAQ